MLFDRDFFVEKGRKGGRAYVKNIGGIKAARARMAEVRKKKQLKSLTQTGGPPTMGI